MSHHGILKPSSMNVDPGPGEAGACFLGQVAAGWQEAQPLGTPGSWGCQSPTPWGTCPLQYWVSGELILPAPTALACGCHACLFLRCEALRAAVRERQSSVFWAGLAPSPSGCWHQLAVWGWVGVQQVLRGGGRWGGRGGRSDMTDGEWNQETEMG